MESLNELFEQSNFQAVKSDLVDGEHIIGVIEGTFFCPDGFSRNKRFYPKDLWEETINADYVKTPLKSRLMFGTLGHKTPLTEETIAEGKASHFMESIWIDESAPVGEQGKARACILNTPAGRILKTLYGAGCRIYSSSRAKGSVIEDYNGVPRVDKKTFSFKGFDFVLDPGFLKALPSLMENHQELLEDFNEAGIEVPENVYKLEENTMSDKAMENLLEKMSKEKNTLEGNLERSLDEVKTLTSEKAVLADKYSLLEERYNEAQKGQKLLESYQAIGTIEEIAKIKTELEGKGKLLESFNELGTTKEVESLMERYTGVKKTLEKKGKLLESYQAMGTIEEIQANKKFFDEVGSKEEILKLTEQAEVNNQTERDKFLDAYSAALKIPKEKVEYLMGKGLTLGEIRELFGKEDGENTEGGDENGNGENGDNGEGGENTDDIKGKFTVDDKGNESFTGVKGKGKEDINESIMNYGSIFEQHSGIHTGSFVEKVCGKK
jgi:uncharacterized protein YerC